MRHILRRSTLHDVFKRNFVSLLQVTDFARLSYWRGFANRNKSGIKNSKKTSTTKLKNNDKHNIPAKIKDMNLSTKALLEYAPVLDQDLCEDNYVEKFSILLYLEEIQLQHILRQFSEQEVNMTDHGEYFSVYMSALEHGYLKVIEGDRILATTADDDKHRFNGRVIDEEDGILDVMFDESFRKHSQKKFNVKFVFNRTSIVRCHDAVQGSSSYMNIVFNPTKPPARKPQCCDIPADIKFFNKSLDSRQKSAVQNILSGVTRPMPYIIFGPPGTGKTMTLVEAILQIYTNVPNCRILVCAPSNSAVDLLALKLHESGLVNHKIMARHFAPVHFAVDNLIESHLVPDIVIQYGIIVRSKRRVHKYKIMLTTCNSAGALKSKGVKMGYYTHVFMDEIGQGMEPEALIPFSLISPTDGQIVLSGDPYQLGPVIMSTYTKRFGLGESLLSRLMTSSAYLRNKEEFVNHGAYDPTLITKLVDNYRSHASIIESSSRLFYDGELTALGPTSDTHKYCDWEELPVHGIPIIFHSVWGTEEQDDDHPSRYNKTEVNIVISYLRKLLERYEHLSDDDIGIITPYKKQIEKLDQSIAVKLQRKITVGSVENFQGKEKSIIIISTVRSPDFVFEETNTSQLLGFLQDPQRFNVAITRAKALLIVIGNPDILMREHSWQCFIEYCKELGVFLDYNIEDENVS